MIADYLNGDINRILDSNVEAGYYINPETAATLFQLYVNTNKPGDAPHHLDQGNGRHGRVKRSKNIF